MTLTIAKVAIVGATGATGIALTQVLNASGTKVRVIARNPDSLARLFPPDAIEKIPADALDAKDIAAATAGADLVVDCIGLPAREMHNHARTAENIAAAAAKTDARILQVSSFWAYLPIRKLPLTETHPRIGGTDYVEARRAAEDILQDAGAAIVNLPDFYGPFVTTSSLQMALVSAAKGGAMNWMGSRKIAREYIFVPDAMRLVAALARQPEAYGQRWVFPGGGPLSGFDVAAIASRHLGRRVKVRAAGSLLLRLVGLFNRDLHDFSPMLPHYLKPMSYDAGKLTRLLGAIALTPYEDAIGKTLDWLRAR